MKILRKKLSEGKKQIPKITDSKTRLATTNQQEILEIARQFYVDLYKKTTVWESNTNIPKIQNQRVQGQRISQIFH